MADQFHTDPPPEPLNLNDVRTALKATLERFVSLQSRQPAEDAFLQYLAQLRDPRARQAMETSDQ